MRPRSPCSASFFRKSPAIPHISLRSLLPAMWPPGTRVSTDSEYYFPLGNSLHRDDQRKVARRKAAQFFRPMRRLRIEEQGIAGLEQIAAIRVAIGHHT